MSSDKHFSALQADEYDIRRTEESTKADALEEEAQVSTSKYVVLKDDKSKDQRR